MNAREQQQQQQQLQMHQLQFMQHRTSSANVLAMKMYEERIKHPHSMDLETSPALIDANRMALLKSATNHQSQLVQGNSRSMSTALQQIQARTQLTLVNT
ncbi:hypothetical protein AAG906_026808 [Vitis piasezkii]